MITTKILPQSINADDDPRFLASSEVLNIENMRVSVSADGKNYALKNIPSTRLLYSDALWTTPHCIGTAVDNRRNRILWLHHDGNSAHDAIYAYDLTANTTYTVLKASQTAEGLHFSATSRADRNVRVVEDLLLWTDNLHEPMCVSIEAGIRSNHPSYSTDVAPYATPIPYTSLTLIRRPPAYRLGAVKVKDTGYAGNFLTLGAFQFAYRYGYRNHQYSVLSAWSQLAAPNAKSDTFNAIDLSLPFSEDIDDEVQQVDLCVRYGNTGKTCVIHSFSKKDATDAAAIAAHNSNGAQLSYRFYNDLSGTPLDELTANTPFDNVALRATTLELAKNRLFLGGVLKGYDTPAATSLTATAGTFDTGGGGSYSGAWKSFRLTYQDNTTGTTSVTDYYYAYNATIGAYFYDTYKFTATAPISLNSADATTTWATETDLAAWMQRNTPPPAGTHWVFGAYTFTPTGTTTTIIFVVNLDGGLQFFKSSSTYQVALAFYDRYRRKCGVTRPRSVRIAERTATQTTFAAALNWTLSNTAALSEIPDWAYYYQVHVTKSETYQSFLQIYASGSDYVLKNQDGTLSYSHSSFAANSTYAVAIDLTTLNNKGIGYVYAPENGDRCRIYKTDGTNIVLPVIGQDGNFVLLSPQSIGALGASIGFLIELYTPHKAAVSETFYETGEVMAVLNPATLARSYSLTSGTINGDCYAIERDKGSSGTELYVCEAMNPNDLSWMNWDTDRGWTNIVDTVGQQFKETSIDWSDTLISGTRSNNLNRFGALNTRDVGNTGGAIQKLQLVSKQQEDGDVLLILTTGDSMSAYLGEVQLNRSASAEGLITTDDVLGTINEHKAGRGTINPESVVTFDGNAWWFDATLGTFNQYSDNGVYPVSKFKMTSFWDRYAKGYKALGYNSSNHPIHSGYDPSADELLIALPAVETDAFAGVLPSYGGVIPSYGSTIRNKFSFYDGAAKTVVYKPLSNKWVGSYGWLAEGLANAGDRFFSFYDGALYVHNEDYASFNSVYGIQYPQRVALPVNIDGAASAVKQVMHLALEANALPSYTVLYSHAPYEQLTDLAAGDWQQQEGVPYASLLRDRLSLADPVQGLLEGEVITSQNPFICIEFQEFNQPLILTFINLFVLLSKGQNLLLGQK